MGSGQVRLSVRGNRDLVIIPLSQVTGLAMTIACP
jgi:hypothetical protein